MPRSRRPPAEGRRPAGAGPVGVEALLQPIGGDAPSGEAMAFDPLMAEIRRLREADDPALPQGDWERPLKVADWDRVRRLCADALRQRSKDLQLAAWWLEAALHLGQAQGLLDGIMLLDGLVERYWPGLHPAIGDDGDVDARVAPLAWLNESLPRTLRLCLPLLRLPERRPPLLCLEDWERQGRGLPDPAWWGEAQQLPTREALLAHAGDASVQRDLDGLHALLGLALQAWQAFDARVECLLGADAPSLARVASTLEQLLRSVGQLRHQRPPDAAPAEAPAAEPDSSDAGTGAPAGGDPQSTSDAKATPDAREAAYRALEQIAADLLRVEPHNPVPYLIRRAVHWGRMPLAQWMREVLRDEGDLERLLRLLGD